MDSQILDDNFIRDNNDGKSLNEILIYGYETHSTAYISKGYELFKQNAGGFIGFLIIAFFARIIGSVIPGIGYVISVLLIPLTVGSYIVTKKIDKNEAYQFSNFFDGFNYFKPLVSIGFIQFLVIIALVIMAFIPLIATIGIDKFSNFDNEIFNSANIVLIFSLFFIAFILILLIYTLWMFANLLVVFSNQTAWQAMETSRKIVSKKLINWFGFITLLYLLNIAGLICFMVGLLVTIPTTLCAIYVAYEDVIGQNLKG